MEQGVVTLDSVIRSACEEVGDDTLHKYRRFEMWALECLSELKVDLCPSILTVKVTIDNYTCSVPFPMDMATWMSIGRKEGNRIVPMIVNNRIIMVNDVDDCGMPIKNAEYKPDYGVTGGVLGQGDLNYWWLNPSLATDTSGAIYGFGADTRNDGHFREDKENRRFLFDSRFAGKEVYIEYVTNGINPSGESFIEMVVAKAVKYYILWRSKVNDKTATSYDKQTAEREYYNEERKAFRRITPITPDKIISMWRATIKQTVKT